MEVTTGAQFTDPQLTGGGAPQVGMEPPALGLLGLTVLLQEGEVALVWPDPGAVPSGRQPGGSWGKACQAMEGGALQRRLSPLSVSCVVLAFYWGAALLVYRGG